MPYYNLMRYKIRKSEVKSRVASKLLVLKKQLKSIPQRTVNDTLLLATWNIRDFDSNKFKHGPRMKESFFYIAEIISAFDLVALQEINEDLEAIEELMQILGRNWSYITTDVTEGRSGNNERMAFVYDRNKVSFQNIAGEIVLPKTKLVEDEHQFARTPFVVAFQSGWFKFMLCTVHIYYGAASGKKLKRRIKEIEKIAKFLSKRADEEDYNYIVLGDFNIVSPEHKTMQALERNGFIIPKQLKKPTNIDRSKYYDQIAFKIRKSQLKLGDSKKNAGVFDYYKSVLKDDEAGIYKSNVNKAFNKSKKSVDEEQKAVKKSEYYQKVWRTFQMSDHLPMWVELKVDFSKEYLKNRYIV